MYSIQCITSSVSYKVHMCKTKFTIDYIGYACTGSSHCPVKAVLSLMIHNRYINLTTNVHWGYKVATNHFWNRGKLLSMHLLPYANIWHPILVRSRIIRHRAEVKKFRHVSIIVWSAFGADYIQVTRVTTWELKNFAVARV